MIDIKFVFEIQYMRCSGNSIISNKATYNNSTMGRSVSGRVEKIAGSSTLALDSSEKGLVSPLDLNTNKNIPPCYLDCSEDPQAYTKYV